MNPEDDGAFLVNLVCKDYIKDHLIPMIARDGKDEAVQRLHERTKLKIEYCKKIVNYLSDLQ